MAEKQQQHTLHGIEPELWKRVKAAAALCGQSLSGWVVQALERHLEAIDHKESER